MRRLAVSLLLGLIAASAAAEPAPLLFPGPLSAAAPASQLCRPAIAAAALGQGIAPSLMLAMARVESGRRDSLTGAMQPWPWTVDVEGQGGFYNSKAQAIAAVRAAQARGARSIDVGCMQVNLMHHADAFGSLELAFDPSANAAYAARFLHDLYGQAGSWPKAAGLYHSATPELGAEYQRKVMAIWPEEQMQAESAPRLALAHAWAATLPPAGFPPPPRRAAGARILPLTVAPAGSSPPGRGLDAYRAAPITMGWRRLGG